MKNLQSGAAKEELQPEKVVAVAVAGCPNWWLLSPPIKICSPRSQKRAAARKTGSCGSVMVSKLGASQSADEKSAGRQGQRRAAARKSGSCGSVMVSKLGASQSTDEKSAGRQGQRRAAARKSGSCGSVVVAKLKAFSLPMKNLQSGAAKEDLQPGKVVAVAGAGCLNWGLLSSPM
ncbi:hypothetical protein DFH07DRAFT_769275 [Mycena maculata]|uniref:Uncharacterized protein n=1 Tax=Mycena maculata TaxID=230809 RepID=A0AAD7JMF7_9AGAR|nr:hypothetical protein DFH07DRAFT_769275 [Mycena maculata]